jgi:hypothetical protein
MKKLFYILAIAVVTSVSFTSCTEEEIQPQLELKNGGANYSEEIKK